MKFKTELKNNVRPIVDEGIFGKMNHLLTRNIIYAQRGLEEILNRDFFVIAGVLLYTICPQVTIDAPYRLNVDTHRSDY